eukprot:2076030-Pleurochrysis_carterae.AAC.1
MSRSNRPGLCTVMPTAYSAAASADTVSAKPLEPSQWNGSQTARNPDTPHCLRACIVDRSSSIQPSSHGPDTRHAAHSHRKGRRSACSCGILGHTLIMFRKTLVCSRWCT